MTLSLRISWTMFEIEISNINNDRGGLCVTVGFRTLKWTVCESHGKLRCVLTTIELRKVYGCVAKGHPFPFFVDFRVRSLIIAIPIKCFYRVHRSVSRSARARLHRRRCSKKLHEGQRTITYNSPLGHEIANLVSKDVIRRKHRGFVKRRRRYDVVVYEPQLLLN